MTHHGLYQLAYLVLLQADGRQMSQHVVPDEWYNVAALGPDVAGHAGHMRQEQIVTRMRPTSRTLAHLEHLVAADV